MTTQPTFNAANFTPGEPIDNPYFPLKPGTIYVYKGESTDQNADEIDQETDRVAVTFHKETIAGVAAEAVRDTAWTNGFLEEDTIDWYAQDKQGNVWYMGESTTKYEFDDEGNFIGTSDEGSWKTGVNGDLPGYIMEANPQVGDNYYQEYAPNDGALDQASVTSLDKTITTKLGTFSNVLQTFESSELSPGDYEFKYYAPGIGMIRAEEGLDKNLEPSFVSDLVSVKSVTPDAFTSGQGTKGNDALDGDNQSNNLKGRQGDDLLQGFGGKDQLTGCDGNDFLMGGNGADLLKGGKGEDILVGDKGADTLMGGKDRDQFVFRSLADRGDLIKDFTDDDVIILAEIFGSGNYGSSNPVDDYLQIAQLGANTVIRIDADGDAGSKPFQVLATLQNTNANVLSDTSFVV